MGWTVLYIAFGIVALWLLGEVLLQYKARLRWRLLAFGGFLGVVIGVLLPSVVVIALGAIAFAVGQTYVTLSFRRGFSTGWAIGGKPGASRRRRAGGPQAEREPTLEVTDLSYDQEQPPEQDHRARDEGPRVPDAPEVYAPEPMPDDTGQYGVYSPQAYGGGDGRGQHDGGRDEGHAYAAGASGYGAYDAYGDYGDYGGGQQPGYQDPGQTSYGYGGGQQQYPSYDDPYAQGGGGQYAGQTGYYDPGAYADPYAQHSTDTPPGGVWVPQQRDNGQGAPPMPQGQPSPYGYDPDYDEQQQYRY
ncbi:hypothetical protein [Streptomyces genisteinicus]|uniref:Uncharacterized protein n=1 Tax=Streptomyces genisteinicus TaxID=2768068 RepID=A0A7H0HQQ5_9ACTN|nr:hypothetical protein [Streptomyces genisteinicus]QNP62871.1 hypothetical protein IAG43_07900 [Streptomyces genisteinicus]